jgi:hypothetical protein
VLYPRFRRFALLSAFMIPALVLPAEASDLDAQARHLIDTQIQSWLSEPMLIKAIKTQNERHAGLTQAEIDRLDNDWKADPSLDNPLVADIMNRPESAFLKRIQNDSQGLYADIFVMDNKGLNVAQSEVTSDYWQGDEAKWQETYPKGPSAIHIADPEFDESTQVFAVQISLPMVDPADGSVIGAVTISVDAEQMANMM